MQEDSTASYPHSELKLSYLTLQSKAFLPAVFLRCSRVIESSVDSPPELCSMSLDFVDDVDAFR